MTALVLSLGLVSQLYPDTIDFWVLIGDAGTSDSLGSLQPSPNPSFYYLGMTFGEPCAYISYSGGGTYTLYTGFWWPDVIPPTYTGMEEDAGTERFFNYLSPPLPNPSKGQAKICYGVAEESAVSLEVYDLTGRRVKELYSGVLKPGNYMTVWTGDAGSGSSVAGGIYFIRYKAGDDFTRVEKLLMVR